MQDETIAAGIAKGSPGLAVVTLTVFGVSMQDVTYIVTTAWFLILIGTHVWKHWLRPFVRRRSCADDAA